MSHTQVHSPNSSIWRNRRYNFLIYAQIVSNLGDWMYILALLILVGVRWHSSPMTISVMMLCITAPILLLGPISGMLADHFNRTVLMIISNLVMAACIAAIPIVPTKQMVFGILICVGVFESLFSPSEQARLKEIVPLEQLDTAISVSSMITQLAKVIGPGLSGILIGIFGTNIGFYLDSLTFIVSTLLLLFTGFKNTDTKIDTTSQPENASFLKQLLGGWTFLRKQRTLLIGTFLVTLIVLVLQLSDSQFVTILRLLPHLSANLFGYAVAASGLGGILSAILAGKQSKRSAILFIGFGAMIVGLGFGGIAVAVDLHVTQWVVPALALFAGGGAGMIITPFQMMVQRLTPSEFTGRVFGSIGSLTTGASLAGPVLGGLLITFSGAIDGFLITGIGLAIIGAISLVFKTWIEPRSINAKSNGFVQDEPSN